MLLNTSVRDAVHALVGGEVPHSTHTQRDPEHVKQARRASAAAHMRRFGLLPAAAALPAGAGGEEGAAAAAGPGPSSARDAAARQADGGAAAVGSKRSRSRAPAAAAAPATGAGPSSHAGAAAALSQPLPVPAGLQPANGALTITFMDEDGMTTLVRISPRARMGQAIESYRKMRGKRARTCMHVFACCPTTDASHADQVCCRASGHRKCTHRGVLCFWG